MFSTIFKGMNYLEGIDNRVIIRDKEYEVVYNIGEYSGSVTYVRYDMNNLLMRGKGVYLMIRSDMGDIIEYIHQRSPLSSKDFNDLNLHIRNHSKGVLLRNVLPQEGE